MVNNGIAGVIYAGYGSEFDMQKFKIAVCDECINAK